MKPGNFPGVTSGITITFDSDDCNKQIDNKEDSINILIHRVFISQKSSTTNLKNLLTNILIGFSIILLQYPR